MLRRCLRRRLEEGDGLAENLDVDGYDQLVGCLDGLAGAGRADVDDGFAHCVEDILCCLEVCCFAADHDGQDGVDCALFATGYGSVERADACCYGVVREALGDVRADAGCVDPDGALLRVGEDAVLAADYTLNIGGSPGPW